MTICSLVQRIRIRVATLRKRAEPIQPPVLRSAVRVPYGPFMFKSQLDQGIPFEIQASTNLKIWAPIHLATSPGEIEFVDPDARKFSHRFYRLRADGVPSANIIGFSTVAVPPDYSLIANPLKAPDNHVAELLKGLPDGTMLHKFDDMAYRFATNEIKHGHWTDPHQQLVPGEGAVFFNPTPDPKNLNFVGEVPLGSLSRPIPKGFSLRSAPLPQPGRLHTDLAFPIAGGDVIYLFNRDQQQYEEHSYDPAAWASHPPILGVGESFWVAKDSSMNWVCDFSLESA
jgi:hypothetical protein